MCIWKYAASQHRLGTQSWPKRRRSRSRQRWLTSESIDWKYGADVKCPAATSGSICEISASEVVRLAIGMVLGSKPASA